MNEGQPLVRVIRGPSRGIGRAAAATIDHHLPVGADTISVDDLVDTDRYPLHALPDVAGTGFLEPFRRRMSLDGVALLEGFVRADALAAMRDEACRLAPTGHHSETFSSPYLCAPRDDVGPDDARGMSQRAALAAVAYDRFPSDSPLRRLYESPEVAAVVAAVLGVQRVHPYADPLGALSLAVMRDGDELGWHFDFSEFVVSLCLQDAAAGGTFDVVPRVRAADPVDDHAVVDVLRGDHSGVVSLTLQPGTLVVFAGRNSLHRVPPVQGPVDRLVALLSYDTRPDVDSTDSLKLIRYGRTVAAPVAEVGT